MANVIGFDPVAFSIDGGSHPASLLRKLAYAATQGAEGIITPLDCKVHQLSSAAGKVNIDTGAIAVLNRSTGGQGQTYIASASAQSTLDVDPTSGSARSDLVVVRLEDPQYSPWPAPPAGTAPTYQYTNPVVIKNVPASTISAASLNLGYSAYALARIDIPSGTTNITDAMIKDLRKVARPRTELVHFTVNPVNAIDNGQQLTSSTYVPWPTVLDRAVDIPSWATEVTIETIMGGVRAQATGTWGTLVGTLGDNADPNRVVMSETGYDVDVLTGWARATLVVADTKPIAASLRGTSQRFHMSGKRDNIPGVSSANGHLEVDVYTTLSVKLFYREVAA